VDPESAQVTPQARGEKRGSRPTASDEAAPATGSSGTLAQETQLFQAALLAERAGNQERANDLFKQLLAHFPASPLAPYARQGLSRTQR
jgi:TolA-binding protein